MSVASSGRKMADEREGAMELNLVVEGAAEKAAKSEQCTAAWSAGEKVPRKDLFVAVWMVTEMVVCWE